MTTLGRLADAGVLGLATDLYQLTMAAAYWRQGIGGETASFELFVRRLPPGRGYLIAAGLEQAVEYLTHLRFGPESVEHLRGLPQFRAMEPGFWDTLASFRFSGDLDAVPEGRAVFAEEPLLRVTAPLIEAQMVETFLLSTINHQTLIASKAARVVEAAAGRSVLEFGARRAHGFESSLFGARAAVIGGCDSTSNVLAGQMFGIPVSGTAAHSFIMAFHDEADAFRAFQATFPEHCILLIDTYDTVEGARRAAALPGRIRGVRLDSGDMDALSREVRRILDAAGHGEAIIVASGDLNEDSIDRLVRAGAPIDAFGVGTEMITSRDQPALGGVYKLVSIRETSGEERPVRKRSPAKATLPGRKQVFRRRSGDLYSGDVLGLEGERVDGEPLLQPILREGRLIAPLPVLAEIRERAGRERRSLPPEVRRLHDPAGYPVALSDGLRALRDSLDAAPD
jgi:nicotinate phosphoribosyltransferase